MNFKNYKHLIQVIFEVKPVLKMMIHKIIRYFNQYTDIVKGYPKDYLMKLLSLHLQM